MKSPNSVLKYVSIARLWGGHPAAEHDESTAERRSHIKETVQHESRVHGIRIDRLTPADLADELERVASLGAGSLPHLRALWRKATARGIALRHITIDPAIGLPLPKPASAPANRVYKNGARRPLNNSLTNPQLATLREEVKVKHPQQRLDVANLIILGSYTGLRINEANSLRWEDVHLGEKKSFLTIEGQVYGSGANRQWEPLLKRESSRRRVPPATRCRRTAACTPGEDACGPAGCQGERPRGEIRLPDSVRGSARFRHRAEGRAAQARSGRVPLGDLPYAPAHRRASAHGRERGSSRDHDGHGARSGDVLGQLREPQKRRCERRGEGSRVTNERSFLAL